MLNPRAKPYDHQKKTNPSFYMNQPYRSFHHPSPSFSYYHHLPPYLRFYPPPPFPSTNTNHGIHFMSYPPKPGYGNPKNAFQLVRKTNKPVYITPRPYKKGVPPPRRRNTHGYNTTWIWRPKASGKTITGAAVVQSSSTYNFSEAHCSNRIRKPKATEAVQSSSNYDFNEAEGKTTVMIKNIPNKLSKEMLLEYLDKHCIEENQKLRNQQQHSTAHSLPKSEYDFLYLPMDFRSGYNLGYAFVNFTSGAGAVRLYQSFHNFAWESASQCWSNSGKICEIKNARIQGKQQLVKHFKSSQFRCHTDEYLPSVFTPPRDGEAATTTTVVGRRPGA